MKKLNKVLVSLCLVCSLSLLFTINVKAEEGDIVQLDGMYTYQEMVEDIELLKTTYPEYIQYSSAGTTALGRDIPYVIVGDLKAPKSIMIQASIHGREYLGTQMCMSFVEYYAEKYANGETPFGDVSIYIVPMSNPDGVCIAQFGADSVSDEKTKEFVQNTGNFRLWKCNAFGVDINRNFDIGWESLPLKATQRNFEHYKGDSANSENETKALLALAQSKPFVAFISYHQQGNVIYYDEPGNTEECSVASTKLAQTVASYNGYAVHNLKEYITADGHVSQGGFTDWVQINLNKPACTVELGTACPPNGQNQLKGIIRKNQDSWAGVANLY